MYHKTNFTVKLDLMLFMCVVFPNKSFVLFQSYLDGRVSDVPSLFKISDLALSDVNFIVI